MLSGRALAKGIGGLSLAILTSTPVLARMEARQSAPLPNDKASQHAAKSAAIQSSGETCKATTDDC
jgi:hypothetical protein